MNGLILALQFLTRFPIPISIDFTNDNLKQSLFFFPIVSGIIGLCVGSILFFLFPYSPLVASLSGLLLWIFLNGGLHMDGLADMFDGFLSNRDREKTLEIMKDSRVGTFGVLSLLLVILSKLFILQAIGQSVPQYSFLPFTMALLLLSARMGVLYSIGFYPSARPGGLGEMFQKGKPQKMIIFSSLFYGGIIAFFNLQMIIVYLAGITNGLLISKWSMQKIGGVTGDIFGAIMEIGEVVVLFVYWGVLQWISF